MTGSAERHPGGTLPLPLYGIGLDIFDLRPLFIVSHYVRAMNLALVRYILSLRNFVRQTCHRALNMVDYSSSRSSYTWNAAAGHMCDLKFQKHAVTATNK